MWGKSALNMDDVSHAEIDTQLLGGRTIIRALEADDDDFSKSIEPFKREN